MEELVNILELFKQKLILKSNDSISNSLKYLISINGDNFSITISLVDYAKYVEKGTYDYSQDPKDLLQWILIAKSLPTPRKLPKGYKRLPGEKKGILPRHHIADTASEFDLINKLYKQIANTLLKSTKE